MAEGRAQWRVGQAAYDVLADEATIALVDDLFSDLDGDVNCLCLGLKRRVA